MKNPKDKRDWDRFATPMGVIRLILLVDWDPIGVFGYAGAMDEYDGYAVDVFDLLASDASQEALVTYLRRVEVERMEVKGNPFTPLAAVAAKLRLAYDNAVADSEDYYQT